MKKRATDPPLPRRRKGKREQLKESSYSDETPLLLGVCSGIRLRGPCPCFAVVCLCRLLLCSTAVRERDRIVDVHFIAHPHVEGPVSSSFFSLFLVLLSAKRFLTSKSPPVTNESGGIDRAAQVASNSFRFAAADTSPDVHIVGCSFCRRHFITSDDVMKLAHTESPERWTGTHAMDADGADTGPPCEKLPPVHIVI
jgi:hypothetical protein